MKGKNCRFHVLLQKWRDTCTWSCQSPEKFYFSASFYDQGWVLTVVKREIAPLKKSLGRFFSRANGLNKILAEQILQKWKRGNLLLWRYSAFWFYLWTFYNRSSRIFSPLRTRAGLNIYIFSQTIWDIKSTSKQA